MRGEKSLVNHAEIARRGSPPHARGKAGMDGVQGDIVGITPACAGKSLIRTLPGLQHEDHPRMRGEKSVCTSGHHQA